MREIALFLHSWHKFYTTAGRDGRDKSQLKNEQSLKPRNNFICIIEPLREHIRTKDRPVDMSLQIHRKSFLFHASACVLLSQLSFYPCNAETSLVLAEKCGCGFSLKCRRLMLYFIILAILLCPVPFYCFVCIHCTAPDPLTICCLLKPVVVCPIVPSDYHGNILASTLTALSLFSIFK